MNNADKSCHDMVGQQNKRTLQSENYAEMQELVVGFIPNYSMHICRV